MRPGELVPVAGPVHLLAGEGGGRFPFCHGVVIKNRRTILIDPGCGARALMPWAEPGRVELVLNTHTHPDHCAGNHLFADSEILVPRPGLAEAGRMKELGPRFAEPGELARVWREFVTREMGFAEHRPSGAFDFGQELTLGGVRLEVIPAPGHTKDHCLFFLPSWRLLISADIDLTPFGPWYGHRESDLGELRRSIARVRKLRPKVVVSAHREPLHKDIDRALQRYLGVIEERNQRILALLDQERSLSELVQLAPIYRKFFFYPRLLAYWEGQMVQKHLNELVARGLVKAGERGFRAL